MVKKNFVNSVKVSSASIKSINPIQNYPHIIKSCACILKILAFMFSLLINVLISFRICSTPKVLEYVTSVLRTYKAIQWVPILKTKDLLKRTKSDKVLKDKAFKIASNPKYDGYQRRLASMV